jgi:hypothetical protein
VPVAAGVNDKEYGNVVSLPSSMPLARNWMLVMVAGAVGVDPLADFSERVAGLFSRITRGAAALQFDGQLPASVVRGTVSLTPDRLSHGGGGALAFAVRLAMAEAYLKGRGGFIMLDDPLVHFDKDRMAVAVEILRTFSASTQVLFFTCHDHHAERLEGEGNHVMPRADTRGA